MSDGDPRGGSAADLVLELRGVSGVFSVAGSREAALRMLDS